MQERGGPVYTRVIDSIWTDIEEGNYSSGALPSMDKLAERHGASRVTVRNALLYLQAQGLVRIRQGHGTFVNVSEESKESEARNFTNERPDAFNKAIHHYVQFLDNSQIPIEVRERMIKVIEFQIGSIEQSQQPTINPK